MGMLTNVLLKPSSFTRPNTPLEAVDVVNRVPERLRDQSLPRFTAILVAADDKHAMDDLCTLDVADHPGIVILDDITTLVECQRSRSIAELPVGKSVSSAEVVQGKPFQLDNKR